MGTKARTRTELARLVRVARGLSLFAVNPTTVDLYCPLDVEAKRAAGSRELPHLFRVEGLRWDTAPKASDVAAALERHLDPDWEDLACPHVQG